MAYLCLACHKGANTKDSLLAVLKSRTTNVCDEVFEFDVPDTLKFGSFDSLIKLMDDLSKQDGQVESILRRVERQMLELDPKADFQVLFRQRGADSAKFMNATPISMYIRNFQWDDTKWPRNRSVPDNLQQLWQSVQRIDEDVKAKAYTFSDIKTSLQNVNKTKATGSYNTAELLETLTPEIVQADDFVDREHLTTLVVVVTRDGVQEFLNSYEKWDPFVCPKSAKKFEEFQNGKMVPLEDKDGSTLWRVVLFKKSVENFRKAAKEQKFIVRDFNYSLENYQKHQYKVQSLQLEYQKQELALKRVCTAAFSDTLVAWMHLKAMRVFVESILRYGVPPNFAAFIVKPCSKNLTKLRGILGEVFTASGMFGQSYIGNSVQQEAGAGAEGAEEAYYPYVSMGFTPQS